MPIRPTYPGVYVEELPPQGPRTIGGIATSVTAFVGYTSSGPLDTPRKVFNFGEFERYFGGLHRDSEVSYGVHQFFANGGSEAWIVRVAAEASRASVELGNLANPSQRVLEVKARSEGSWGNDLYITVDYATSAPNTTFNLAVYQLERSNGQAPARVLRSELFRNLEMNAGSPAFVESVVNHGSELIVVKVPADLGVAPPRPAPCGTVSSARVGTPPSLTGSMGVTLYRGTGTEVGNVDWPAPSEQFTNWKHVAEKLQIDLRSLGGSFKSSLVEMVGGSLVVRAGAGLLDARIEFADNGETLAHDLGLSGLSGATISPSAYELGRNVVGEGALLLTSQGSDGIPPTNASLLIGSESTKTGLHALDDVEDVNILAIPSMANVDETNHHAIAAEALAWCKARRAFFLLDPPLSELKSKESVAAWWGNVEKSDHGATFVPGVKIPDPLDGFRLRLVPPSGTMAGLFSRTDGERGIWKAAAGTDARLVNVQALQTTFTDAENGFLNQMGVNVLRELKVYGRVAWGARTLAGSDAISSPWKYISVRRLALHIEESLRQGLQWAVFEPNDEPLWARMRASAQGFMQGLFRRGAFQGQRASEAFLVKIDKETTTQQDIDNGVVNILIGFAPLKPAEFVIIQLQQLAGQNPS